MHSSHDGFSEDKERKTISVHM